MRNFEERKAEIFNRSDKRISRRKRIRNRAIAVCGLMVVCVGIGSFAS